MSEETFKMRNLFIAFDRIYYGFKSLKKWTENKVTWVTRMHYLIAYQVTKTKEISTFENEQGIICDELIIAGALKRKDKIHASRIIYKDPVQATLSVKIHTSYPLFAILAVQI